MISKKKLLMEVGQLVPLGTTNYSNLKFVDKAKNDEVNKALLDDINTAAKSVGIIATITTAKTGHSRLTKGSKNVSRHMNGTGVDVGELNSKKDVTASNPTNGDTEFRETGFKLKDALVKMGYSWNTESGKDKAVLWHTNTGGNHFNHLHISNRLGVSTEPTDQTTNDNSDLASTNNVTTTTTKKNDDSNEDEPVTLSSIGNVIDFFSGNKKFSEMEEQLNEELDRIHDIFKKIL